MARLPGAVHYALASSHRCPTASLCKLLSIPVSPVEARGGDCRVANRQDMLGYGVKAPQNVP